MTPLVLPANEAGVALSALTASVKSPAVLVPPLSLMTIFLTISFAGWSSLVIVQVAVAPLAIVSSSQLS